MLFPTKKLLVLVEEVAVIRTRFFFLSYWRFSIFGGCLNVFAIFWNSCSHFVNSEIKMRKPIEPDFRPNMETLHTLDT